MIYLMYEKVSHDAICATFSGHLFMCIMILWLRNFTVMVWQAESSTFPNRIQVIPTEGRYQPYEIIRVCNRLGRSSNFSNTPGLKESIENEILLYANNTFLLQLISTNIPMAV